MVDLKVGQWRKFQGYNNTYYVKIIILMSIPNNVHGVRIYDNGRIEIGQYYFTYDNLLEDEFPLVTFNDLINLSVSQIAPARSQIREILEWLSLELRPSQENLFA